MIIKHLQHDSGQYCPESFHKLLIINDSLFNRNDKTRIARMQRAILDEIPDQVGDDDLEVKDDDLEVGDDVN